MHFLHQLLMAFALLAAQGVPGDAVAVPRGTSNASTIVKYTLPQDSSDPIARAAAIAVTQVGFTYGPPVAGGPYYPSGILGSARAAADLAELQSDLTAEEVLTAEDSALATAGSLAGKVCEPFLESALLYGGVPKIACSGVGFVGFPADHKPSSC